MMERAALDRPIFTVIGGPNGVGKSTYTEGLAARGYPLGEVVNPDVIAANLPGPDATRDARAGRETLRRTRALIASGRTFSRETTLSGSEILRTMRAAKNAGFTVNLFFVGVDSVDVSEARVRRRVARGGGMASPSKSRRGASTGVWVTQHWRREPRIRRCSSTAWKNNSEAWAWPGVG